MRRPHRVPLLTAALAVLEEARTLPASDNLVFPSRRGRIIHHSTIALALRTAGLDTTLHGFRATFRYWALENGADWAASELALAHELGNAITQADLFPFAPILTASADGRISGAEWVNVLVTFVLAGVFIWRMARRRQ